MADQLDPEVETLSREIVAEVAPQELALFRSVSREYARDPRRVEADAGARDETLGFGVEAGMLLTPLVISVAEAVIRFVAAEVLDAGKTEGRSLIQRQTHSIVERFAAGRRHDPPPPARHAIAERQALTPSQLAEVRKVAVNRALALKLPREQSERLADAMVARLAVT